MKAKNVRTFELKLGKRALILFILGISFLLFGFFLLGVRVGKIMDAYPEKIAQGVPYVIMDYMGWPSKQKGADVAVNEVPKETAAVGDEKMDLTFYDTLARKKKSENIIDKKETGEVPVTVHRTPPPTATPEQESQQKSSSAMVNGQPPVKPSPSKGKYQIQVVSLKQKEKADKLRKKLVKLGYSPHIVTAELKGRGKWFRVVLDGFDSEEQAHGVANSVSKKVGNVNCVVRKISD